MSVFLADAVIILGITGLYTAGAVVASVALVAAGMKVCEVIDRAR